MRPILALSLAAAILGMPRTSNGQPATDQVMSVVKRLFDGMRAGDSVVVRSVFHTSARLLSVSERAGQVRTSVESNADGFVKAVGTPHPERWDERIWNEKVAIDGALASVWVDYAFYLGDKFSHCGVDHFLLVKDDAGTWKIVELADTRRTEGCSTPPPPGAGSDHR